MIRTTIYLSIAVLLSSCFTERIDLDLNAENPKLAVDAWIKDFDEPQFITLSRTVNYLGDQQIDYVTEAVVTLSDDSTSYQLTEETDGRYYLPSNWVPRIGDMYVLDILYDGDTYTAAQQLRPCPELENLKSDIYPESDLTNENGPDYEVFFSFQENEGPGDGYFFKDYKQGSPRADSAVYGGYTDDEFIDGWYVEDVTITGNNGYHLLGDTAMIEIHSIGFEAAGYIAEIEAEIFRESPFEAPPANVRTNISNGAVGYFIISSSRREEIIIGQEARGTLIRAN